MNDACFAGGCFCGAVRYEGGPPLHAATLCHCESCRRISGAHAVGWLTVSADSFRFVTAQPAEFHSSAPVTRSFCARCGSPLTYRHQDRPLEIDVTLATVDRAAAYAPMDHIYMADALPWDRPADGWPQYRGRRTGPT
jgi:hypothetical protein